MSYIIYSIETSNIVSKDIMDCDIAMANGFNWIPPCSLIDALEGKEKVIELCNKYLGKDKDYEKILKNTKKSQFDYRKFLKARE